MNLLKRNLLFITLIAAAGAAVAADTANPAAPAKDTKKKPAAAQAAPQAAALPTALNGVAQAAAKAGVTSCAARINQVTNFLTTGSQSRAVAFISPTNPNQSVVSYSLEVQTSAANSYASATFAPVGPDGCGATYEAVTYWNNTCEDVANRGFAGTRRTGPIQQNIQILEGTGTMRVFLIPAGQGCVSIKKEVVM